MKFALAIGIALPLLADSGIDAPALGRFLDSHGVPRTLGGVPGAFVIGTSEKDPLLGLACSNSLCIAKNDTKVLAGNVAYDAEGPALIGVEGSNALLYFAALHQFALLHDGHIETLHWTLDGEIIAVGLLDGVPQIAVREGTVTRIINRDGGVQRTLDAKGPVELLRAGVAYANGGEVVIRRNSGTETRYPFDADSFFRPSAEYLGVRTQAGTFLIRLTEGREDFWQLPEAAE
jgi:hypothetical protein